MKRLIALVLMIVTLPAYSDSIKCYSHGKLVYSHLIRDVTYTGDLYVFIEESSDKMVFVNADCIVKIYG